MFINKQKVKRIEKKLSKKQKELLLFKNTIFNANHQALSYREKLGSVLRGHFDCI